MTSKAKEGDKVNWYCNACKRTHKGSTEQVTLSDGRVMCMKAWLSLRRSIFKPLKRK